MGHILWPPVVGLKSAVIVEGCPIQVTAILSGSVDHQNTRNMSYPRVLAISANRKEKKNMLANLAIV
jgi:hypothetical protein